MDIVDTVEQPWTTENSQSNLERGNAGSDVYVFGSILSICRFRALQNKNIAPSRI
jgi:hypothetical protein